MLLCLFLFPVVSICSRSECKKRKAIWDACVAEIKQDPGQKKDFDTQMLAVMDTAGQYTQNRLIHVVLFDRLLPSLHILSNGSNLRLGNLLAIGFIGREDPFPIFGMRCARRRCESN
jgi:hypothetical protein